jgi:phosphonate degradation associated HDIG domain protein
MSDKFISKISNLFKEKGETEYYGEKVSITDHVLQAAYWAEKRNLTQSLIVGGLLHDIGHLVSDSGEDYLDKGNDNSHEFIGFKYLSQFMPPEVTLPIKLHVSAKRYLCTTDIAYFSELSNASKKSFYLQGGEMNATEKKRFEGQKFFKEAIALRKCDDAAKNPNFTTPSLKYYFGIMQQFLPGGKFNKF